MWAIKTWFAMPLLKSLLTAQIHGYGNITVVKSELLVKLGAIMPPGTDTHRIMEVLRDYTVFHEVAGSLLSRRIVGVSDRALPPVPTGEQCADLPQQGVSKRELLIMQKVSIFIMDYFDFGAF